MDERANRAGCDALTRCALTLQENRHSHKLRDGEVVVFLRVDSEQWQCRYKLKDMGWVRRATRTRNLEVAIERACDWYDEARYRLRAGIAPELKP